MKFLIDKALSPQTVAYLIENDYNAVRVDTVIPGTVVEDETILIMPLRMVTTLLPPIWILKRFWPIQKAKDPPRLFFAWKIKE